MKYAIFDWISGHLDRYKTKKEAIFTFEKEKQVALNQGSDFDKMVIEIFEEHNSID